jgi:AhpC/TSA antioxidant enzyme
VANRRAAIESAGTQVAFVHMSEPGEADHWFEHYGVPEITRISDPTKQLYRAFGLEEATLSELGHPRVWWPWLRTAVMRGFGLGGPNWRQLTGAFVVHRGHLLAAIRHRNAAARPDYVALVHGLKLGAAIR